MSIQDEGWSDFIPTAVKPAIYAYKYRKYIQDYWKKFQVYAAIGEHNIKVACLPVCPMPEPFLWNNETVTPQIDSVKKIRSYLRNFVDNIALIQHGL